MDEKYRERNDQNSFNCWHTGRDVTFVPAMDISALNAAYYFSEVKFFSPSFTLLNASGKPNLFLLKPMKAKPFYIQRKLAKACIVLVLLLIVSLLPSCNFLRNSWAYKKSTQEFVQSLIREDYDKCISLMVLDYEGRQAPNRDTLKMGLAGFRKIIVNNWGTKIEFSQWNSSKKFSTEEAERTPPNTTLIFMEFDNDKDFGVLKALFDDKSKKILSIETLEIKRPIPDMTWYWQFGLLALCVLAFNIYVIRQIRKSDLNRKWLKYLAVACLNLPTITYSAINGLSFKILSLQILCGISFSSSGYLNSYWAFGLPLGGLYWLWRLKRSRNEWQDEMADAETSPEM